MTTESNHGQVALESLRQWQRLLSRVMLGFILLGLAMLALPLDILIPLLVLFLPSTVIGIFLLVFWLSQRSLKMLLAEGKYIRWVMPAEVYDRKMIEHLKREEAFWRKPWVWLILFALSIAVFFIDLWLDNPDASNTDYQEAAITLFFVMVPMVLMIVGAFRIRVYMLRQRMKVAAGQPLEVIFAKQGVVSDDTFTPFFSLGDGRYRAMLDTTNQLIEFRNNKSFFTVPYPDGYVEQAFNIAEHYNEEMW